MEVRERPAEAPKELNPTRVSSTRLDTLAKCGVAFQYKYVQQLPGSKAGVWALFGSVVHRALERWAPDRSQSLVALMEQAWLEVTKGTAVAEFLEEYRPLADEARRLVAEIKAARPDIVKVLATADWKKSEVAQKIAELRGRWVYKFDDCPWLIRPKDSLTHDYAESFALAERYQERWRKRPAPIVTECKFELEWRGFTINGVIDAVEPIISPAGELLGTGICDYKTGQVDDGEDEQKHRAQLIFYDVAVPLLEERGALPKDLPRPLIPFIDYVRLGERRAWTFGPKDHDWLEGQLKAYSATVRAGAYLKASKMMKGERCDYPEMCCLRTADGGDTCSVEVDS